ncbi:uncharacterized protein [Chelonus insularis]|uniref:uncharacterized protein n=1 Tax=Chelonus insularis TaxID=460826 RepID=UPI00158E9571|nr:uncharacterized protein LOC118063694 [Chelonus insularis]
MNAKTIVILFTITIIVLMLTINEAEAQRGGRCRRRCTGGPRDRCVACGTRCPATCRRPNPGPCTKDCVINVCQCQRGWVRAPNGRCVRPNQCLKSQGNKMTFSITEISETIIQNMGMLLITFVYKCKNQDYLQEYRYFLLFDRFIINVHKCIEMDTNPNKVLFFVSVAVLLFTFDQAFGQVCNPPCRGGPSDLCLSCASYCPKTCAQPQGPDACIAACRVNACECAPGYVRAPNGMCIRQWQCPRNETVHVQPLRCNRICSGGPHDVCKPCGTRCPPTCENPGPRVCTKDCAINVCECQEGFVRAPNGQCIRPEFCPNRRPPLCYARAKK